MSSKKRSKYIEEFKNMRMFNYFQQLYPELLRRSKSLKEITEAFAMIRRVKKLLIVNPEDYVVIDVCSGIGYFTALASLRFPKTRFIAIDKGENYIVEDFKTPNAKRLNFDIYSSEFEEFLKSLDKKLILVGIHLCGELSERFIELSNKLNNVEEAFLMPCCIGDFEQKGRFEFLADLPEYRYNAWVLHLVNKIDINKFKINTHKDINVLSPKNVIIKMKKN